MTVRQLIERSYPFHDHLWDEFEQSDFVRANSKALEARTAVLPPPGDLTVHCASCWDQGAPSQSEIDAMERQRAELGRRLEAAKAKLG